MVGGGRCDAIADYGHRIWIFVRKKAHVGLLDMPICPVWLRPLPNRHLPSDPQGAPLLLPGLRPASQGLQRPDLPHVPATHPGLHHERVLSSCTSSGNRFILVFVYSFSPSRFWSAILQSCGCRHAPRSLTRPCHGLFHPRARRLLAKLASPADSCSRPPLVNYLFPPIPLVHTLLAQLTSPHATMASLLYRQSGHAAAKNEMSSSESMCQVPD